jgi:ectoine hydroxylase-related dioxygenase (phytanoyl-CoA dioxygenase family)
MTSQNSLRTPAGAPAGGWHVDDDVYLPLPEHLPRHASAPPPMIMHAFVLLSDVPSEQHGPTQIVPGSHWSGRRPAPDLQFDGRGPVSVLGRAGDLYLHHNQTWHRRAENRSDQVRYVVATAYGRRWVSQRLWPFVDYRLPEHVVEGADTRLQRVLGRHPRGSYA